MSRRKRFIQSLTEEQKASLLDGYKNGATHHFRVRCQSILQSSKGKTVSELSQLHGVSLRTVYIWFNRWESEGIQGLHIRSGRGRKRKLDFDNSDHKKQVKQSLKKENRNLNQLKTDIESSLGFPISKITLRRFLKKLVTDINGLESA